MDNLPKFTFAIDTMQYAGNFERQITAFVVGVFGDCEVGSEIAERVADDIPEELKEIVQQMPDDHGCHRPTSQGPTPGWWNDGYGSCYPDSAFSSSGGGKKFPANNSVEIYFHVRPTIHHLNLMMKRAKQFAKDEEITIIGFRLFTKEIVITQLWGEK